MKAKKSSKKKYYLFNCENFILGRMSAKVSFLLQGKNKPQYASNKTGDCFVIVTNCEKINVSGQKEDDKMYHSFSGYPGGITSRRLKDVLKRDPQKIVWESVYGMLPKNKLRDVMMKRMIVCQGENHGIKNAETEEIKS